MADFMPTDNPTFAPRSNTQLEVIQNPLPLLSWSDSSLSSSQIDLDEELESKVDEDEHLQMQLQFEAVNLSLQSGDFGLLPPPPTPRRCRTSSDFTINSVMSSFLQDRLTIFKSNMEVIANAAEAAKKQRNNNNNGGNDDDPLARFVRARMDTFSANIKLLMGLYGSNSNRHNSEQQQQIESGERHPQQAQIEAGHQEEASQPEERQEGENQHEEPEGVVREDDEQQEGSAAAGHQGSDVDDEQQGEGR